MTTSVDAAKKRICILLPTHWDSGIGGAEYQTKILTEYLINTGAYDVHVLCRQIGKTGPRDGYHIHEINDRPRLGGSYLPDIPDLWRLLRSLSPSIIYQRVGCAQTGVAAHYVRTNGGRLVWHVAHDWDVTPSKWRLSWKSPIEKADKAVLEYGVRNASAIVVQTLEQGRLLKANYHRDFTACVRNFHPIPDRLPAKQQDRLRVCWVANVRPWKQPQVFVELAESFLDRDDVEFVMAGSPEPSWDQWASLEERMRTLRNFSYLGARPQESINALLDSSHVLVNTSLQEGFSNVFVQAWAREVPVVGLHVDPDGLLTAERIGMFAAGDFGRFRAAVCELLDNPELRSRMGARARQFAKTHFSMSNVRQLLSVLDPENVNHTNRSTSGPIANEPGIGTS